MDELHNIRLDIQRLRMSLNNILSKQNLIRMEIDNITKKLIDLEIKMQALNNPVSVSQPNMVSVSRVICDSEPVVPQMVNVQVLPSD